MSSKRMISDNAVAEDSSQCNIDDLSDEHAHPRVTAKKTFFDLHRHRRRNDVEAADLTHHPRIQWSAGTTSVGNGYQRVAYDESVTHDIMKPVLQREPSRPDPASIFQVPIPESNLPPVPDTWGSMDAQPTQPEEVQHLLEFSPVIQRTSVPEEVIKPRRKFGEVFRKRSTTAAVLDTKSSEASRASEEQLVSVSPEEEFRLLNERYIRDGVIPAESSTKEVTAGSTGSQTRFGSKKGKKDLKASGTSLDRERSIGHRAASERDRRIPRRESFHEKRVTIDIDVIGYATPEGSSSSPLPARRSCEPLDVNNLRKLRESETGPSTSGVDELFGEFASGSTSDVVDEIFATRATKIFVHDAQSDEVVPSSDSEDSSKGPTKEESCKVDSFKIDNPFSDFSLQKVNRDKGLLRQRTVETAIKTPPSYRDPAQPGTSNGAYAMEIYRRKVSRSESIERPKKKSREHSFLKSAVSRMKRASSFLDKAVTAKSSQRIPDSMTKSWARKSNSKEETERSGIDRAFGKDFLEAIVQRLCGNSVASLALMGLRYDQDNCYRENMVFHCYDHNLQFFLTPLMEIAIEPIFYHFVKNYPSTSSSGFSGGSFDTVSVMANDVKWVAETVSFFETAWPKTVDNLVNVSRIVRKNMASVYSAADEAAAEFPLLPDETAGLECLRSDELVDKITHQVVNIITSQNLIREIVCLSFSPMPGSMKNKHSFEGSYFPGFENHWPFAVGFFAAPIVIFFDDFLNLYEQRDYQRRELLERFFFNLIGSTMRNLRFAYI